MPTPDALGRLIPDPADMNDVPGDLAAFSLSLPPGPVEVASRAEANSVRAAYQAAGGEKPIYVWRTDIDNMERDTGSGWEYVAGRQHGATVVFSGSVSEGGTPQGLSAQDFVRASHGWTVNGDGYLVVPQTGMFMMYGDANLSGSAGNAGRTFIQFATRTGAFGSRIPATNENNYAGMAMWPLSQGDQLRVLGFHTGGGTRTYNVTMQIAMINSPNW